MGNPDQNGQNLELRPGAFEEAEKLLKLAEDWQDRCESLERRIDLMRFLGIAAITVTIGFVGTIQFFLPSDSSLTIVVPAIVITYLCGIIAYMFYRIAQLQRFRRRDKRAMLEIVKMLREIEKAVAEKHNLSALERVEFRIRLSRFEIGNE